MTAVRHLNIATEGGVRGARMSTSHPYTSHVLQTCIRDPSGPASTLLRNLISFYQAYRAAVWGSRHNFLGVRHFLWHTARNKPRHNFVAHRHFW